MNLYFSIAVISLVLEYSENIQAAYVEGYLINQDDPQDFPPSCLKQVADTQEGNKFMYGYIDPEANDCDLLVLETGEDSTYEEGGFSIQFKESGKYLYLGDFKFYLADSPQDFFLYDHDHPNITVGLNALVNSTNYNNSVFLMGNGGTGERCLYNYAIYAYYGFEDYAYFLAYGNMAQGAFMCDTHFWFIEVESSITTTEMMENSASLLTVAIQCTILPLLLMILK